MLKIIKISSTREIEQVVSSMPVSIMAASTVWNIVNCYDFTGDNILLSFINVAINQEKFVRWRAVGFRLSPYKN